MERTSLPETKQGTFARLLARRTRSLTAGLGPHFTLRKEPQSDPATSSEHEATYFPLYDWLRAVLAIVVMVSHLGLLPGRQAGALSVQIFFALSGWLIGGILLRLPREELMRFYFNRSLRIWVPYYLGLAVLLLFSCTRDPITGKWWEFVVYKLTFVYNLFGPQQIDEFRHEMPLDGAGNHFWSVNAEEQFYLVAPLLLVLMPRWGRHWLLWCALAIGTWVAHIRFVSIVFGVLAAVLVDRWGPVHERGIVRIACGILSVLALGAVLSGQDLLYFAPWGATALILLLAVKGVPSRLGTLAGGMSYPLYLNHWLAMFLVNGLANRYLTGWPVVQHLLSVAVAVLMATAIYLLVDRRLRWSRAGWYSPARGRLVMWVAYGLLIIGVSGHFLFTSGKPLLGGPGSALAIFIGI